MAAASATVDGRQLAADQERRPGERAAREMGTIALAKPFGLEELAAALHAALAPDRQPVPA